jgi:hypothetical protein
VLWTTYWKAQWLFFFLLLLSCLAKMQAEQVLKHLGHHSSAVRCGHGTCLNCLPVLPHCTVPELSETAILQGEHNTSFALEGTT